MKKNALKTKLQNVAASARLHGQKLAVGALAFSAAPAAFAQTAGFADAVTSNVDTAELIAIGLVVVGISGIVMMVRRSQRVAS